MNMEGKVAIVTGAARGIGKSCTAILLKNKVKVCMVDVQLAGGEAILEEFKYEYGEDNVTYVNCDVRSSEQLEGVFKKTIKTYGKLDIVLNNAGICDETRMTDMVTTNLVGAMQGCYLGIKYMGTDNGGKGGVIINMASITSLAPFEIVPAYSATKHGLMGFTRSMGRVSEQLHGIRMNALCPGWVETPLVTEVIEKDGGMYGLNVKQQAADLLEKIGIVSADTVAESFWKLLLSEMESGQCVVVGPGVHHTAYKMPKDYHEVLKIYTDYNAA